MNKTLYDLTVEELPKTTNAQRLSDALLDPAPALTADQWPQCIRTCLSDTRRRSIESRFWSRNCCFAPIRGGHSNG
jgi:hypothetical protein